MGTIKPYRPLILGSPDFWPKVERRLLSLEMEFIRSLGMSDDQLSRYSEAIGAIHARFNAVMKRNENGCIRCVKRSTWN